MSKEFAVLSLIVRAKELTKILLLMVAIFFCGWWWLIAKDTAGDRLVVVVKIRDGIRSIGKEC